MMFDPNILAIMGLLDNEMIIEMDVQHNILRNLIHSCGNEELGEFILEMLCLNHFKYGDRAIDFYNKCVKQFGDYHRHLNKEI